MVQKRGAAILAARKLSSAMSAAKAICDHLRSLWFGTTADDWVSMGVLSGNKIIKFNIIINIFCYFNSITLDGSYGIEKDLMYSFPVRIDQNKNWTIVQGLEINDWARGLMDNTAKELIEERNDALETTK